MKQILRKAACAVLFAFAAAQGLFAQNVTFESGLNQTRTILRSGANTFILVVQLIIGLGGVAYIGINLFKYFRSQSHDSNNDLLKIGVGLLVAIVLLQVVKTLLIN